MILEGGVFVCLFFHFQLQWFFLRVLFRRKCFSSPLVYVPGYFDAGPNSQQFVFTWLWTYKTGISPSDSVSQKNEANIFITGMHFSPLLLQHYEKHRDWAWNTEILRSLSWAGAGKKKDPMGPQRGLWHGYKNNALSPRCKMYFRENWWWKFILLRI